jgi:CDGSH-type Zn-finger protein
MEKTKLTIVKNGPLRVEGEFEILDQNGNAYGLGGRTLVSLCRCGHSKNKPFCDGAHKAVDWLEEAVAFDLPPKKII